MNIGIKECTVAREKPLGIANEQNKSNWPQLGPLKKCHNYGCLFSKLIWEILSLKTSFLPWLSKGQGEGSQNQIDLPSSKPYLHFIGHNILGGPKLIMDRAGTFIAMYQMVSHAVTQVFNAPRKKRETNKLPVTSHNKLIVAFHCYRIFSSGTICIYECVDVQKRNTTSLHAKMVCIFTQFLALQHNEV